MASKFYALALAGFTLGASVVAVSAQGAPQPADAVTRRLNFTLLNEPNVTYGCDVTLDGPNHFTLNGNYARETRMPGAVVRFQRANGMLVIEKMVADGKDYVSEFGQDRASGKVCTGTDGCKDALPLFTREQAEADDMAIARMCVLAVRGNIKNYQKPAPLLTTAANGPTD